MSTFLDTLADIENRYDELEQLMADPTVTADHLRLQEIGRERAELDGVVTAFRQFRDTEAAIAETETLAADPELADLAAEELRTLRDRHQTLIAHVRTLLIPKDPNDDKNVIVEIRAGTGGDEAALFAADLFRMYTRFAERNRWKTEILSATETDGGGFREVIFEVRGKGAYSHLRYESRVHRVQRVQATERQVRIHTSTASVAVLPEADEVDIQVNDNDLRVDVYRSTGHGGQSVNTTDSAVRITHLPTGIVVSCQDEKSQLKNKVKAMKVLRSRLLDAKLAEVEAERARDRKLQVGTGDRSAKIRTYNFPQGRVTDHRIGLTLYQLQDVLNGDLDELIEALKVADEAERLGASA